MKPEQTITRLSARLQLINNWLVTPNEPHRFIYIGLNIEKSISELDDKIKANCSPLVVMNKWRLIREYEATRKVYEALMKTEPYKYYSN